MKTLTETIYTFSELPKEGQQKAISNYSDINTDYRWFDYIEEDLNEIGCELVAFELNYNTIEIDFQKDVETIASLILEKHGNTCETYIIAKQLLSEEIDEDVFLSLLQSEYIKSLRVQYEYLCSDEAIAETLETNGYHFDLNGKIRG